MAIEKLYIENTYIPLTQGLNPSITKELKNLSEPDKAKASYSKTVSIPRSKEADKIFSHIFEINVLMQGGEFNVSARADVRYEVDSEIIIQGYLKLNEISVDDFQDIVYDCTMYNEVANFFSAISNAYLPELYASAGLYEGLDIYDHILTKELQQLSWDTSIIINNALEPFAYGTGYLYPLIDFGYSQNATDFIYTQIGGAIYENEYIRRMIAWAGFTLKSGGFLDTDTWWNHLITPASPECYQLTTTDIEDREFAANTPQFTSTGTTTSSNLPIGSMSAWDIIKFTNDSTGGMFDPNGNYNTAVGVFTAVEAGTYNISTLIDINATFTPTTGAAVKTICDIQGYIGIFVNGSLADSLPFYITSDDAAFVSGARSTSTAPTYPDTDYMNGKAWGQYNQTAPAARNVNPPDRYQLTVMGLVLVPTDYVSVRWMAGIYCENDSLLPYPNYSSSTDMFVTALSVKSSGNATISVTVGSFYNKVSNLTMTTGNTVEMSDFIPNVKMTDYFMAQAKRFNWIIDVDPLNPYQLIIETRDEYLGTDVLNIHDLIDRDNPVKDFPMELLDAKSYLFTYKKDVDYFNQRYSKSWQEEIYGQRICTVETDFANEEKKTELIFSPTCMVGLPLNDRVLPTIYALNDYNQPITTKFNIRSLYYGGMKPCLNAWNHTDYLLGYPFVPLTDTFTTYPYCGHFDDPYNPTLDLNFGLVKEVYYDDDLNNIVVTDNNVVNKYHGKQLREMTDSNSRIIKCHVHLTPLSYVNFTFDKLYYFDYAYFRLQKIEGYNPTAEETTLCTFFKVNNASDFTPATIPLTGAPIDHMPTQNGGGIIMTETTSAKGNRANDQPDSNNYTARSVEVNGYGNYVGGSAKQVEIYGDGNQVHQLTENIKIQGGGNVIMGGVKNVSIIDGNSNTISAGVENVTLINTSNVTVTLSNVTYIDGKIKGYWETKTANFNADPAVEGYYMDCSAGNVRATLLTPSDTTSNWTFKRIDDSLFECLIDPTDTIDGEVSYYMMNRESVTVKWNDVETDFIKI